MSVSVMALFAVIAGLLRPIDEQHKPSPRPRRHITVLKEGKIEDGRVHGTRTDGTSFVSPLVGEQFRRNGRTYVSSRYVTYQLL